MAIIKIKRAFEPSEESDGFRMLVDRLWPRGIKKEDAHFDVWMREIAPSKELRKWFNHEAEKWEEFYKKYSNELKQSPELEKLLKHLKENDTVTLVFGAKDKLHNHAVVLKEFIENG